MVTETKEMKEMTEKQIAIGARPVGCDAFTLPVLFPLGASQSIFIESNRIEWSRGHQWSGGVASSRVGFPVVRLQP